MPKCVDCDYEGTYFDLPVPFELIFASKFGMPGANVSFAGFEEEMKMHGFTDKEDLSKKAMHCRAPGGGPTETPIALVQALADQPCSYFSPKKTRSKTALESKNKKWWEIWK